MHHDRVEPTMERVTEGRLAARHWLAAVLLAWLAWPSAHALADGLQEAGRTARQQGGVVMLVFWADDCPYCRLLDEQVLEPWQRSSDFHPRVAVQRVDIRAAAVTDFDGSRSSGATIAARYRAVVTPTVQLVDGDGERLGEPLVGIATVDFYLAYLEAAIARALKRVGAPTAVTPNS